MPENDCWYIDGNKIRVYPMGDGALNYSRPINGLSLYELLWRGDWHVYASVYVSDTNPICIMIPTYRYVDIYNITRQEFDKFRRYYCGVEHKQELDWRKCGF